ncbi:hypothetical protein PQG02_18005 [Nostoc sp. UHCC 0926]|nr:hypothetical protein [Nostoc sp. UHCC 0926]WDD30651.1 hypothetical protein PQG02_18005 [Nostoc sp. UHCC 0926]
MILETDRLLLRQMTLSDLDALLLVLGDAESMRPLRFVPYIVWRIFIQN